MTALNRKSAAVFLISLLATSVLSRAPALATGKPERFDDWTYRCGDLAAGDGKTVRQCEVVQVARVKQGEKDVDILTLAFARMTPASDAPAGKADNLLLTALVPLNVHLGSGFRIDADNAAVLNAAYRNCNQAGCWVAAEVEPAMIAALEKGQTGNAHLRLMTGQGVNVKFSLKGLTAALKALRQPATKPATK